jgi:hypothetical protein
LTVKVTAAAMEMAAMAMARTMVMGKANGTSLHSIVAAMNNV